MSPEYRQYCKYIQYFDFFSFSRIHWRKYDKLIMRSSSLSLTALTTDSGTVCTSLYLHSTSTDKLVYCIDNDRLIYSWKIHVVISTIMKK